MRKTLFCLAMLMLVWTQACTHKAWYEGIQQEKRSRCYELPTQERDNCLKQAETSYEEYQRERKEVLGNKE